MPRLRLCLRSASLAVAACLAFGANAAAATGTAPSPDPPSIDDATLGPAARIAAGRGELNALKRAGRSDGKRAADVARALADLLGGLDDGHEAEHHEEAIEDYLLAMRYYTRKRAPEDWAALNNDLGVEYRARLLGSDPRNTELAVRAHRAALAVYTKSRFPELWAMVQSNLCVVLRERTSGSRRDNVEAAIAACRLALFVRTREAAPAAFAVTSANLALAIGARSGGSRRERLDSQIAAYEDAIGALAGQRERGALPRLNRQVGLLYAERGEDYGGGGADLDRAIGSLTSALSVGEPGLDNGDRAQAQQELGRAYHARRTGDRAADEEHALAAYREALKIVTRTGDPDVWMGLQIDVGNALQERVLGDAAENIDGAIEAYRNALSVTSARSDPANWAAIQNDLGTALDARIRGERTENLKQAVTAYESALGVGRKLLTRSDRGDYLANLGVAYGHLAENELAYAERALRCFRQALSAQKLGSLVRGQTENNMGTVLLRRQRGGAAANIEAALNAFRQALKGRTRARDPLGWAQSMDNLGTALFLRVRGDRAENLEQAIHAYEDALGVRTREAAPRDWAASQSNLAEALVDRIRGGRGDNVDRAIQAYLAALTVYTEHSDPIAWSAAETNLGNAYMAKDRGNRAKNIEAAITAFDDALRVRTRASMPLLWANSMNDRANAYGERSGESRRKYLDLAIAGHEATLAVWTKAGTPVDWSSALNNLGTLFADEDYPERAEGIERAIRSYRRALSVRTRASLPIEWASTRHNMANAYMARRRGDRSANLEEAIRGYRAALTVRTRRGAPLEFVASQKGLARAYGSRLQGDPLKNKNSAARAYAAAMDAIDDVVGEGLDARQTISAMKAAGELFRSAALLEAREGRLTEALAIAERGRARTLQLALRLDGDGLALPEEARERLEGLRIALRETVAQLGGTPAEPGAAADPVAFAAGQQELRARAETLRARIAATLPQRRPQLAMPTPPEGGAVVIPLVAREGATMLILTGKGLSALDLPGFDDARLRAMFYGPTGRLGEGGWSKGYESLAWQTGPAGATQDWAAALASFQKDAWVELCGPLAEELERLGVAPGARVVLVTQDYLARMPLWLAKEPQSGQLLGELYRITSAPNLASLQVPARNSGKGVAAWFNDAAFPALQMTSLARQLFTSRAGAVSVVDAAEARTPEALIESLQGSKEWFLWTHGRYARDDPRASGIQLAGIGSAALPPELSVGALLDARFDKRAPDLVVLSACESGLADVSQDDELVGLPTALLQAGARGVISAMWPVREDATALLMAKFAELTRGGATRPSDALRLAAEWLRRASAEDVIGFIDAGHPALPAGSDAAKGYDRVMEAVEESDAAAHPFADPYFWGAFSLVGVD